MLLVISRDRTPFQGNRWGASIGAAHAGRTSHPAISPELGGRAAPEFWVEVSASERCSIGPVRPLLPSRSPRYAPGGTPLRHEGIDGSTANTIRVSPSSAVAAAWAGRGFGEPSQTLRSRQESRPSPTHVAPPGKECSVRPTPFTEAVAEGIQFEARNSHQCGPPGDPSGHSGRRPSRRDLIRRA